MTGFLLSLVLFLQTNPTGTVTGVVRNAAGMPAAGVRVYAMAEADPKQGGNLGNALEGLSQTDDAGRFRLEVPAGRYYIAAGSVESPTYFPGTTDRARARVVSITSAAVIENVDIAGFVPATRAPSDQFMVIRQMPGATGVISGVIQYADGTPAVGLYVSATPANLLKQRTGVAAAQIELARMAASLNVSVGSITTARGTQTDANGRYRFENVAPDTYYIAAGFADSPTFYPGVSDVAAAATITTTPTTKLDTVNLTIPPARPGSTISGRISTTGGLPALGAIVQLRFNSTGPATALLPGRPFQQTTAAADGSFDIPNVAPGRYAAEARMADASAVTRSIVVEEGKPVSDLNFTFAVAMVTGQVLSEDGKPFPNLQAIGDVGLVTGTNPNAILTTLMPPDGEGRFSRVMEAGEYRFFVKVLPAGYVIKSMTAGNTDLMKSNLTITGAQQVQIEVRIGPQTGSPGTRVRGTVMDVVSGKPVAGESLMLCCLDGPVQRLSATPQPDGSFEFVGVPPGTYTAELKSRTTPALMDHAIAVGDTDVSGVTLLAAADLVPVTIFVVSDDGNRDAAAGVTITLSGTAEVVQIARSVNAATGQTMVWVPVGDSYKVTISNIPDGYIVKGIAGGDGTLLTGGRLTVMKGTTANVAITIGKR